MEDDKQIQAQTSEEILIETLRVNVDKACVGSVEGVKILIEELRESTSSMTSVPKPMKHLIGDLERLVQAYHTYHANPEYRSEMADLLSLLSIVNIDKGCDILTYRLESPIENIGAWGHEYVKCLTHSLITAYQNPGTVPAGTNLDGLISQISSYFMAHNDEPDACDLLIAVDRINDIIELVDEESHTRVCIYLLQCYNYLSDPLNTQVLEVLFEIYTKLGKTSQALVIAMKMNDREKMHDLFVGCEDPALKKQLAFLLARQLTVFEDEMDEELTNIATNAILSSKYIGDGGIVETLGRGKVTPKTPDQVLGLQQNLGQRRNARDQEKLMKVAKSFASAFHNAAIKKDNYYIGPRGDDALRKNEGNGLAVAVASLGMLNLWDIESGPNVLDKWTKADDSYMKMGALTGIGITSAAVRSEFDPAIAFVSDALEMGGDDVHPDVIIGCIFCLAMAYAGSEREDILEMLSPFTEHADSRVVCYACMAIGLVFIGTCNDDAATLVSDVCNTRLTGKKDSLKFEVMAALGLGLIFMGSQSNCEVVCGLIASDESDTKEAKDIKEFIMTTVCSCAYAGTGYVVQIQKNLKACTGENSISHAAAVLGIAIIALGDPVGCQMSKRMFEHILQYGKPDGYARRMVPIAIALTSISWPQPETVDSLRRIGHDMDTAVAQNAILGIGLLAAGTQNKRARDHLESLGEFHKDKSTCTYLRYIADSLTVLGQGLMTLSPTYNDSTLLHPVALGSLLTVAYACIHTEELLINQDPLLLYFIAPAIGPRFLVTLDEELNILPLQVRVGQAIDVVGQAGRPRDITGWQTSSTPVELAAGQRAEFVDDTYEPLSPILDGFVIMKKRTEKKDA